MRQQVSEEPGHAYRIPQNHPDGPLGGRMRDVAAERSLVVGSRGKLHGDLLRGGHGREQSSRRFVAGHRLLVAEERSEGNISSPKTFDLNGLPRSASRSSSRSLPVFRCLITVDIPVSPFSGRLGLLEPGVLHTERASAHVDVLISKIIQRAPSTMPCCHTNISLSKLRSTSRSRLLCGSVLTSRFNRRLPFHLQDRDRAHSAS